MRPHYSIDTAFEVAHTAALDSLRRSIESIDLTFGDGYAKKNPYLVSTMVKASAAIFGTMVDGCFIEGQQNK